MNNIGRRLRFFRAQRKASQMDVELDIDAAFGSLSRMESGHTNPTKETVEKIARFLKLSDRELDYLIGPTSVPATLEECDLAIKEISPYFDEKGVIAYLVDDRLRIYSLSKSTRKLVGLSDEEYNNIIGKTMIELILLPELKLSKFFSDGEFYNLKLIISRFISEMGYMVDDEYYQLQKALIISDKNANKLWNELNLGQNHNIWRYADRKIEFNYFGKKLELRYANEPLAKYKRFDIVEYLPNDSLTKLLSKSII
jgi:transcriptional regulator with XRE-family HTH domain